MLTRQIAIVASLLLAGGAAGADPLQDAARHVRSASDGYVVSARLDHVDDHNHVTIFLGIGGEDTRLTGKVEAVVTLFDEEGPRQLRFGGDDGLPFAEGSWVSGDTAWFGLPTGFEAYATVYVWLEMRGYECPPVPGSCTGGPGGYVGAPTAPTTLDPFDQIPVPVYLL